MENNEDSDVEMVEMAEEGVTFQRTLWQQRLLPYYKELQQEADHYISNIKAGMAYSVLMRDARPGLIYWVHELDRFISLYSYRFTKIDHINILKFLYNALTMKNLDFRVVKVICGTICNLLSRKSLLSRTDLEFDWRPLYELYVEVAYKNLEEDGLLLLPDDMKKVLQSTIIECNHFFSNSATQEILDEVRPYFCPWDDSFIRGMSVITVFIPTALDPGEHEAFGAKLWVDELLAWLNNPGTNEKICEKILYTLQRLARDSPGWFDFSPQYSQFFTILLSTLKLELGVDRVMAHSSAHMYSSLSQLIAYSYGMAGNKIQEFVSQLFLTLESYFHPSNTGMHTTTLLNFLLKLVAAFMYRVGRERYHANRYRKQVPASMKLTDQQVDAFVKAALPCLEYAAFSKVKGELVPSIIRILAFLSPGIIIPFVLDLVYPSLQTLIEPHRLTQSLHILSCICIPIARDNPARSGGGQRLPIKSVEDMEAHLKSYRKHAILIMNNILPGLDVNDISKSTLSFQILTIFLLLIPVVDCSQAPQQVADLSDDEKELCSATAEFDGFIDQLMGRIFSMIELLGSGNNERHALTTKAGTRNMEELVIEKGVLTVFRALLRNCNTAFYTHITDRFYNFVSGLVYNSKPAMDTITKMASAIVSNDPGTQFPRFFKFALNKFKYHYHDGCEEEEEVDHSLIWFITFASDVVRGAPGATLLQHRQQLDEFIACIRRFKSQTVCKLTATFVQNILYSLCSVYPFPKCYRTTYDQPFDKYLPIRHWADTVNKDKWSLDWHVPTDEEVDYASALVQQLVTEPLERLVAEEKNFTDKEALKHLTIARFAFEGCSNLCPFFDTEVLRLIPMAVPNVEFDTTTVPSHVKKLTAPDGTNYRRALFKVVQELSELFLKKRENDTKSSIELLHIMRVLLHVHGIDPGQYYAQAKTFQQTKRILTDPLRGFKETIETIMEGTIAMSHTKRMFHRPLVGVTATHVEAFQLLFRFATSLYSVVRLEAQKLLDTSFISWSFSYKLIIDQVLPVLKNPSEFTYEQFKGALYILINGKEASILVRQDWESLSKIWPVLCLTQSPEEGKQSVITLLDFARDLIINNFSSFQIGFTFPEKVFPLAQELIKDYSGNVHKDPLQIPEEAIVQTGAVRESELNEGNKRKYLALANSLYEISADKQLHWRHVDFAQALLSLLVRRDAELPEPVVLHFFQLIVSDSIKTRKMAVGFVGAWLKIHRQKARKLVQNIEREPNQGPGAQWPIKYGLRKDNCHLLYDVTTQPATAAQWDSSQFYQYPHWGFYTWPAEFRCYAPPAEQQWANRSLDELTPMEKSIVEIIRDGDFLKKLSTLYSLEEKKGSEEFDSVNWAFFYRIFRSYNDILLSEFMDILDPLLKDQRESHQRLAAEIVAGMVCGAKLWRFEKQQRLVDWLRPRLCQCFVEMSQEAEKNWGTCMATIFGVCEPRQAGWLIDMLFELVNKPTEISFHIKTRLYLLHCALNQSEWRVPVQWRQLAEHCLKLVDNIFQNVRLRVGSCLATSAFCDFKGIYVDPALAAKLELVTIRELIERINEQIEPLWKETLDGKQQQIQHIDSSSSLGELMFATEEHKQEKLRLITLINFLYSLTSQFSCSSDTRAMELIPLLAHYSNDNTDEELKGGCLSQLIRSMGLGQVMDDQIEPLFAVCSQVLERARWWKTKITLLRFLQVFVFSNLFILRSHPNCMDKLLELILKLLVDPRFEVRVASAETLSGLVRAGIISVDARLLQSAEQMANSSEPIQRHSGVLALSAIVLAHPYSVPEFLPQVLMRLCKHASEPQPVFGTVKRALSEFKRTHHDEWHEHKLEFTEDQLQILTDLIISPNYYV